MINKEGPEKRQHERYELKDRVFITIRPQFDRIGWLTDISKGGVSFEYLTVQDYSILTENVYVDIFSSPREYDLSSLPCKLIYDTPVNKEKGFMESIETRRCGMAFGGMSQQQAIHLDLIMSQHT